MGLGFSRRDPGPRIQPKQQWCNQRHQTQAVFPIRQTLFEDYGGIIPSLFGTPHFGCIYSPECWFNKRTRSSLTPSAGTPPSLFRPSSLAPPIGAKLLAPDAKRVPFVRLHTWIGEALSAAHAHLNEAPLTPPFRWDSLRQRRTPEHVVREDESRVSESARHPTTAPAVPLCRPGASPLSDLC